eukprot:TRINITY_DN41134_c0_g1_i1.p1 TRINITY_DN41134_c0_g1~~TRINITY_DN41134_c0_g1_i1.p1  ORF type:complete len:458 (+),score=60.43 TRINITY_DN41134_c0_g1_i1:28-1401(+)
MGDFPWAAVTVVGVLTFAESVSLTMIYPFLAFMIVDFEELKVPNEDEAGTWAGLLGSAFALAQFVGSPVWGRFYSKWGAGPVLLSGCLFSIVALIVFGTAQNFSVAITARFIHGLMNGNVACTKAYLGEHTNSTNRARAFSLLSLSFGLGYLVGPVIGGMLSDPVGNYNWQFLQEIFEKHKYLIPSIITALVNVVGVILILAFVQMRKNKISTHSEKTSLLKGQQQDNDGCEDPVPSKEQSVGQPTLTELLSRRIVQHICSIYCLISFGWVMQTECFALWAAASRDINGLDLDSDQIGTVLAANGCFTIFNNLILFTPLANRFGFRRVFFAGCLFVIFGFAVEGFAAYAWDKPVGWIMLYSTEIVKTMGMNWCYASTFIMINNSVGMHEMGAVNGLAQSAASLARAVAPTVGGIIFAITANSGASFPFNFYFFFLVLVITFIAAAFLAHKLPVSLDG